MMNKRLFNISFIILIIGLLACKVILAETDRQSISMEEIAIYEEHDTLIFPDDWLGYWQGDLQIYNTSGIVQTIPMALDNAKTNEDGVYTWAITYGTDTIAGRRDYLLKEIDAKQGHYMVDEQNGILLDAYLIDNELISIFEVMGNTITSKYKREADHMIFEILMRKAEPSSITGDTIMHTDTMPPVKNFMPVVKQIGVLSKQ